MTLLSRPSAIGLGLAFLAAACARSAQLPESLRDDRRDALLAEVRALDARMASGPFVEPLAETFAPTGFHVSPGPLSARGPASVRAWLAADTLNATSRARWTVVGHGVSADGEDGYSFGHFLVMRASGDSLPGSYKAYWRRSAAGRWQLLAMQRARDGGAWPGSAIAPRAASPVHLVSLPARDTAALLRDVMATEQAFSDAAAHGVGAAFAAFAAPDGAKAGPAGYVFGPTGIAGLFAGPTPPSGGPKWSPEVGTVANSGDLAFTVGPVVPRNPGAAPFPPGAKYFTVWRLLPDGRWRYVVD